MRVHIHDITDISDCYKIKIPVCNISPIIFINSLKELIYHASTRQFLVRICTILVIDDYCVRILSITDMMVKNQNIDAFFTEFLTLLNIVAASIRNNQQGSFRWNLNFFREPMLLATMMQNIDFAMKINRFQILKHHRSTCEPIHITVYKNRDSRLLQNLFI